MSERHGLYVGTVRHRRFLPTPHDFEYALFMALLDIDHLADAMAVSRFTSYNRFNWASFDERDHLGDPQRPLRDRLAESARAAGHSLPEGQVLLLTHLRYAGYVFNPISLFYCFDQASRLRLVLAEVNNTYGGRRHYWLESSTTRGPMRARAAKSLYVSPFMDYDVGYEFVLTPPGARLLAHMNVGRAPGGTPAKRLFDATLRLERRPWTAPELRRALLRFPLMTTKVVAAIHWQALRLSLKGLAVHPFPRPEAAHTTKEDDDADIRSMGGADDLARARRP